MKNLRGWGFALLALFVWLLATNPPGKASEYGAMMFMAGVLLMGLLGLRWWPVAIPVIAGGFFYPILGQNVWVAVIGGGLLALVLWQLRSAVAKGIVRLFKGKPQYGRRWDDNPNGPGFDPRRHNRHNRRR